MSPCFCTHPILQVAYFYDDEVVNHNYGGGNPMRPHRARLTMELVKGACPACKAAAAAAAAAVAAALMACAGSRCSH